MQFFAPRNIVFSCSVLIFALATAVSAPGVLAQDGPAIEVGSETMDASTVRQRIDQRMQQMKQRFGKQLKKKPGLEQKIRKRTKKQVVDQIVNQLTILTHAKKSGVSVDEDEVNQRIEELKNQQPEGQSLQKMLEKSGMNEDQFNRRIQESILVNKYIEQETGGVSVSTEDARNFYNENSKRFKNRSFKDIKDRIVQMIEQRKKRKQAEELVSKLKEKTEVTVRI